MTARNSHAAAFHQRLGKVTVFGGHNNGRRFSDLWGFDGGQWIDDDPAPPAYAGSAMVFDRARGTFVLFGGAVHSSYNGVQGDQKSTWVYSADDGWRMLRQTRSPQPRSGAAFVYDEGRRESVLFGGFISDGYGNPTYARDTWTWNGATWRTANAGATAPPKAGPMFYDPEVGKIVLVSVKTGTQDTGATWLWDGASWIETDIETPSFTTDAVYDKYRQVGVLRGWGHNLTWLWDGSQWNFAYEDDADELSGPAMIFDERASAVFCYGGSSISGSYSSAISWEGSAWKNLGPQPPGRRGGASIAFDPFAGHSILFGGLAHSYGGIYYEYHDDTWALSWVE